MACYLKEVGQMMTMNKQLTKKLRRKKKRQSQVNVNEEKYLMRKKINCKTSFKVKLKKFPKTTLELIQTAMKVWILMRSQKPEFWQRKCSGRRNALKFQMQRTTDTVLVKILALCPVGSLRTNQSIIGDTTNQLKRRSCLKKKKLRSTMLGQARKLNRLSNVRRSDWLRQWRRSK